MIPLSLPEPGKSQPRHFTWLLLGISLLSAAYLAEKAHRFTGIWTAPSYAQSDKQVSVSVGPAQFQLQAGLISAIQQRSLAQSADARFSALRLAFSWPELAAAQDHYPATGSSTVIVDLDSNPGRESLRARLEPFFRRLARGGELTGPDGLKVLTLSARGAPASDLVAYDPTEPDGFIARCRLEPLAGAVLCHRAKRLESGLELRYRFDKSLLADWRRLDKAVLDRVDGLRVRTKG